MEEDSEKKKSISFKKIDSNTLLKLSFYLASKFKMKIDSEDIQIKYGIKYDESFEKNIFRENISKIEGIITKEGGATGYLIHFQCVGNYNFKKEKTFFKKIYFPIATSEKSLIFIDEIRGGILDYFSK